MDETIAGANEKKLQMVPPPLSHAPNNTYLMCILLANKNSYPWIMENFINIQINNVNYWDEFFRNNIWFNCPFLVENSITWEFYNKNWDDFSQFAQCAIDLEYYIFTSVNRRYISLYNTNMNISHNPIIYGYNLKKRLYNVGEFFPAGYYSTYNVPMDELNLGIKFYGDVNTYDPKRGIRLIKYNSEISYTFSTEQLKMRLVDYVNSTNLYEKFHFGYTRMDRIVNPDEYKGFSFGLNYYDILKKIIQEVTENIEIRPFQLLVFKNWIMNKRINFLVEKGMLDQSLYSDLKMLSNETVILRNTILKDNITKNGSKNIDKNLYRISYIKNAERLFLEKVINSL